MMQNTNVYRTTDNELMGCVVQTDNGFSAQTTFGYTLAPFASFDDARQYLQANALEALIDRWQFWDESLEDWYKCDIVEATPEKVTYRIADYGHPDVQAIRGIKVPVDGKLRRT